MAVKVTLLFVGLFISLIVYFTGETVRPTLIVASTSTPTQTLANTPLPASLPSFPPNLALPLLAWTVAADDGAVYVMDSTTAVHHLTPIDLRLVAKSSPLFAPPVEPALDDPSLYLLASETYLFVGQRALTQTLVLKRDDFSLAAILDRAGPMALDPGRRLFMISDSSTSPGSVLWAYNLADLKQPPLEVIQEVSTRDKYTQSLISASLIGLVTDPVARRLYASSVFYRDGRHSRGSYTIIHLDTLEPLGTMSDSSFEVEVLSAAREAGLIVVHKHGRSDVYDSSLILADRSGQELSSLTPFEGQPRLDPTGQWLYVLRPDDLGILRTPDLTVQHAFPFLDTARDLIVSPDGQTLYLFDNYWLAAFNTDDLRSGRIRALPFTPVSAQSEPSPCAECGNLLATYGLAGRIYPSPDIKTDQTTFIMFEHGHIYRTTDNGRSWLFLPALTYPDFDYRTTATTLSISPDFVNDRTLIAGIHRAGIRSSLFYRSTDGGATWAEWSPRLAFVSDRNGNREIYLMNQQGGDLRRLTYDPSADENPAWSPAWTRLAFQSNRHGNWDIFSMRLDCDPAQAEAATQCDLRQLTTDPADDSLPAWSPDGRSIAFVSTRDGNPEIYVMDKDGQNQRRLTFHPGGDWRPAWLEDSRRLVFTSDRTGNNDIYQLTVPPPISASLTAELELTPLITDPADDRDPASLGFPDTYLLFLSNREGITRAYRQSIYSILGEYRPGSWTAVSPENQAVAHPVWIDNVYGDILITMEQNGQADVYLGNNYDGFTALTGSPGFDGHPAWGAAPWIPTVATNQEWLDAHR